MAAALYMDAVIKPNRSLPATGFKVIMGVVIGINLVLALVFFSMGAWLAPPFLGLDVLLLYLAFRASFRAAERSERVQVSADTVRVIREDHGKVETVWTSPTAFTAVDVEQPDELEARVRLRLSGKRYSVGRALSPGERLALADALRRAIRAALSERYVSP